MPPVAYFARAPLAGRAASARTGVARGVRFRSAGSCLAGIASTAFPIGVVRGRARSREPDCADQETHETEHVVRTGFTVLTHIATVER